MLIDIQNGINETADVTVNIRTRQLPPPCDTVQGATEKRKRDSVSYASPGRRIVLG